MRSGLFSVARNDVSGWLLLLLIILVLSTVRAEAAEDARSPFHLRVVALLPLTGGGASLGSFMREGLVLAQQDIEARYPQQIQIELDMLDTKGSPIEAVSRLQAAIARQKPDVVISALSPVAKAVRPIVEKEGILTLVTSTVLNDLARGTEHVVRLFANADDWTRPVAHYVQDHFKTLAVLHLQDDFGLSILNSMQRELAGSAVRIVSVNSFEMMQRDIRSLVLRALEGSPEAVYVIGYGPAYINIIKQVRQSDPALTVLADATFSDPAVLTALGAAAEGVIYDGMDFNLENPVFDRSVRFREYYLQTWGRLPYAPAGLTYDALQAVVQAAYRDGRFGQPNKAQVIELSPLQGVVGNVSIDADGESSFPYILVRQERGKAVQVPGY